MSRKRPNVAIIAAKPSEPKEESAPVKGKSGPKPIPIDEELLTRLANIQCTYTELAAIFNCSEDTLQRRYAAIIKKGQEEGKSSLRRLQFRLANEGNASMAMFLGKIYLDQREGNQVQNVQYIVNVNEVPK